LGIKLIVKYLGSYRHCSVIFTFTLKPNQYIFDCFKGRRLLPTTMKMIVLKRKRPKYLAGDMVRTGSLNHQIRERWADNEAVTVPYAEKATGWSSLRSSEQFGVIFSVVVVLTFLGMAYWYYLIKKRSARNHGETDAIMLYLPRRRHRRRESRSLRARYGIHRPRSQENMVTLQVGLQYPTTVYYPVTNYSRPAHVIIHPPPPPPPPHLVPRVMLHTAVNNSTPREPPIFIPVAPETGLRLQQNSRINPPQIYPVPAGHASTVTNSSMSDVYRTSTKTNRSSLNSETQEPKKDSSEESRSIWNEIECTTAALNPDTGDNSLEHASSNKLRSSRGIGKSPAISGQADLKTQYTSTADGEDDLPGIDIEESIDHQFFSHRRPRPDSGGRSQSGIGNHESNTVEEHDATKEKKCQPGMSNYEKVKSILKTSSVKRSDIQNSKVECQSKNNQSCRDSIDSIFAPFFRAGGANTSQISDLQVSNQQPDMRNLNTRDREVLRRYLIS
jgi:hypothetical protein